MHATARHWLTILPTLPASACLCDLKRDNIVFTLGFLSDDSEREKCARHAIVQQASGWECMHRLRALSDGSGGARLACPAAASAPEPLEATAAPPDKGGQALRRELMRPQAHTSDDVNKQAMAMGGQLMMRAAAGQQVCPVPICSSAWPAPALQNWKPRKL